MKFKKKYQYIFFDLDNTLWDFNENSYYAMQEAYFYFNISEQEVSYQTFHEVYIKFNHYFWQEYRNKTILKKDLIRLRFEKTFEELMIIEIDPLEMNNYYLSLMPNQKKLVDGTEHILDYLKSKGCSLYIITNGFREVQHKKMENSGLTQYFSKVFISEAVKSPKPSKEIFEYAIKSANAKKSSSIMVGDDLETDVDGALDFGMDAVHFCPFLPHKKENNFYENRNSRFLYRIKRLEELKKII
jgi:putative hydrolase of the HAD superfamily